MAAAKHNWKSDFDRESNKSYDYCSYCPAIRQDGEVRRSWSDSTPTDANFCREFADE